MKFGPVPLEEAEGKILGHNIAGPDGRRAFRKGKPLTAADIETLRQLGRSTVYVATLEADDVDEDTAARRIAEAAMGVGLRLSGPSTGRANLYATIRGLVRVDVARLMQLNACPGVTLATLPTNIATDEGKMVATMKVLPYAIPEATVRRAEEIASTGEPLLRVDALAPRAVGLILSGSPSARDRIVRSFETAMRLRLEALGSTIERVDFVPLEEEIGESELVERLQEQIAAGLDMIILAGETAIMDRYDIAPRAVERAGGEVTCFGAPVDPGNLLMLAYVDRVPVLGAPGCARSPKDNIIDLVLPRLLAGDRLSQTDIVAWGHGGLLEDVPERPMPRSRLT
ncbi:MAG TPA: molybdopterin-binding protein [Anaerolineae bacterium]